MASPQVSDRDHADAKSVVISGALRLAKEVVMTQLQDIDPIVVNGIKESFARLEKEALGACLPVSPLPASLPPVSPSLPSASLAPASLPPAPALDQPERILGHAAEFGGEELVRPAEKDSSTVSQGGETSQPLRDDNEVKKDGKRPGPFWDSSDDDRETLADKRKAAMRNPTKYPAVNEANYLRDEVGCPIDDDDAWGVAFKLKRPWMTTKEEAAFFAGQSFERCFKCVELGHNMENCPQRKPRCRRCDRAHQTLDCRSNNLKCGVCGGKHVRGREGCRTREIEVLKEKLLIQYYSGELP